MARNICEIAKAVVQTDKQCRNGIFAQRKCDSENRISYEEEKKRTVI